MIDYKDFGNRIRTLRRQQSLTQEELAEQAGISHSFMGHIERGTRVASLETLVALCNVLHTSPQYLLGASLTGFEEHMPSDISQQDRKRLGQFLRLAQDTLANWDE